MAIITTQPTAARALWLTCLASASRTALACSLIACATLYGPAALRRQVAFPAFSYVVAILVVTDAALGDTIRGCWLALFATVQTVCPAILVFWFIGPTKFSYETIALAVAVASVVVMLPTSTHLVAKRIALGQIVIIYVVGFIQGVHTEPLMHPIHVAASTAMGVVASVSATLLPFPRLASLVVKQKSQEAAEIAAERLTLFVEALAADDTAAALRSISKAASLSSPAAKLLPVIKRYQESMPWERIPFKFCRTGWLSGVDRLQELGTPLRGMEMALASISSYPVEVLQNNQELKDGLNGLEKHISLALKQANGCLPSDSLTFPESNVDDIINTVHSIQTVPVNDKDLPPLFFIFCMKLLQTKCQSRGQSKKEVKPQLEDAISNHTWFSTILSAVRTEWASQVNRKRLIPALKCALTLGLAVLLGLIYSKENGFWASLPVAVSFAAGREPTFRVANVKIQGTVLGSVYGVLSFVLFERFLSIRLLCLLPWFVLTSFLQRSRMYGPAGGISAVIGAVLILGRTNFGSPSEFAMARIVEAFIGISSLIIVDILLQPTRASKMAKIQLTTSFRALQNCVNSLSLRSSEAELTANRKTLQTQIGELKKFIEEAEVEPNFWFLPLHSSCYRKLLRSLTKMADLIAFTAHAMKNLEQNFPLTEKLDGDVGKFKEMVVGCINFYADVTSLKSLKVLDGEVSGDLEMGKPKNTASDLDEMEREKLVTSFLLHSAEVMDDTVEEGDKSEEILSLTAMAFCLLSLMKETQEIGKAIGELIQWENPSSNVDLNEITCKLNALKK